MNDTMEDRILERLDALERNMQKVKDCICVLDAGGTVAFQATLDIDNADFERIVRATVDVCAETPAFGLTSPEILSILKDVRERLRGEGQ